jgi:ABC-type sugar transport system ATPase subunit
MTMADRVAVIKGGRLQAFDAPDDLYDRPRTLFIGGFVGNPPMNFAEVEVGLENGEYHARGEGFDLVVPAERGAKAADRGTVIMGIRPEDIAIADDGIVGEIYVVEPLGRDDLVDVRIGEVSVHVLANPELRLRIGDPVRLQLNTRKVQFFDPETEQSLLWA